MLYEVRSALEDDPQRHAKQFFLCFFEVVCSSHDTFVFIFVTESSRVLCRELEVLQEFHTETEVEPDTEPLCIEFGEIIERLYDVSDIAVETV